MARAHKPFPPHFHELLSMKRRLFLQAAPAAAALTLVGCGGGGGGGGSGSNLAAGVTSTAGSVSGVITDCP